MQTIPTIWPFPPEPIAGTTYEQLAAIAVSKPAKTARKIDLKRAAQQIDAATAELKAFNDGFTAPF